MPLTDCWQQVPRNPNFAQGTQVIAKRHLPHLDVGGVEAHRLLRRHEAINPRYVDAELAETSTLNASPTTGTLPSSMIEGATNPSGRAAQLQNNRIVIATGPPVPPPANQRYLLHFTPYRSAERPPMGAYIDPSGVFINARCRAHPK